MDSIQIDSGVKNISINGDPARVITFNPSGVLFAERFYQTYSEFQAKIGDFEKRSKDLASENNLDENGIPVKFNEQLTFMRETCDWMCEKIDQLFGAGTSDKAFQGELSFEMIAQFLQGVMPFISQARSVKIDKYAAKKPHSKVMK